MELNPVLLLDDGEFYIQAQPHEHPLDAPGRLYRRGSADMGLQLEIECLGRFVQHADTSWEAYLWVRGENGNSVERMLIEVTSRKSAIVWLWQARRTAHCKL